MQAAKIISGYQSKDESAMAEAYSLNMNTQISQDSAQSIPEIKTQRGASAKTNQNSPPCNDLIEKNDKCSPSLTDSREAFSHNPESRSRVPLSVNENEPVVSQPTPDLRGGSLMRALIYEQDPKGYESMVDISEFDVRPAGINVANPRLQKKKPPSTVLGSGQPPPQSQAGMISPQYGRGGGMVSPSRPGGHILGKPGGLTDMERALLRQREQHQYVRGREQDHSDGWGEEEGAGGYGRRGPHDGGGEGGGNDGGRQNSQCGVNGHQNEFSNGVGRGFHSHTQHSTESVTDSSTNRRTRSMGEFQQQTSGGGLIPSPTPVSQPPGRRSLQTVGNCGAGDAGSGSEDTGGRRQRLLEMLKHNKPV